MAYKIRQYQIKHNLKQHCVTYKAFSGREWRNMYHILAFRDFKNILLYFFLYEIEDFYIMIINIFQFWTIPEFKFLTYLIYFY